MQKMKVIFVASGNQKIESIAPFVQVQMDSLAEQGVEISLYRVVGRGIKGYVTNTIRLRKILKREQPDIVHAHYSICGYLASIANLGLKPSVVVSLMGSDMVVKLPLIRFFSKKLWDMTIVKSREMFDRLNVFFMYRTASSPDQPILAQIQCSFEVVYIGVREHRIIQRFLSHNHFPEANNWQQTDQNTNKSDGKWDKCNNQIIR